jgi:protein-disulfide isomerase
MPTKTTRRRATPKSALVATAEKDYSYAAEEKKSRKKIYFLLLLIILIAILVPKITSKSSVEKFKNQIIPNAVKLAINNPQTKFTVKEVKETNGVYEFKLAIGDGAAAQSYTSYITKDGKLLFTSGINIDKLGKPAATPTPVKKTSCSDLPKTDKPNLTAFVVANCPFGLQMQRVFNKAIVEASDMANYLTVKYIGSIANGKISSMHGDEEAQENLRQICIREEQPSLYWPYVSCYMKAEGQSQNCLNSTGVDQTSLSGCTNDATKGLKYAQVDFDAANKFGVTGSPTLVLNNKQTVSEFDFGGRIPDSIKQILCCGTGNKPVFCSKALSKTEAASSFSEDGAAAGGSSAASCGN